MTAAPALATVPEIAPRALSPFPSRRALQLEQTPMRELGQEFMRGGTPDLDDLVGWEFRGINHLPLAGDLWGWDFEIEGRPKPRPGDAPHAFYRVAMPGYFETMRLPLLRGRAISESDDARALSPGRYEFFDDFHKQTRGTLVVE